MKKLIFYIPFTEELNGFLGTNCNRFFLFRVNNNQQKLLDEVFFPHLKSRFVSVLHLSKMYPAEAIQQKYVSQVKIFAPNSLTLPPRNVFCVAEFRLGEHGILDNNMRERDGYQ